MLALDDLIQPLTEDQELDALLSALELLGLPARSWRPAGVYRTILRVVARLFAALTVVVAGFIRAGFLDSASGQWLTMLARYVFGVARTLATQATVTLVLNNGGGGVFPFGIGECIARNPTTKKTYSNTTAFTLNPGDVLTLPFIATEAGSASNAAPNTITEFTTTLVAVTVTNPAAAVGTDDQKDDDLKSVCRNKRAAVSVRGPRGAYAYAVQTSVRLDGTPVDISRMSVSADPATGIVHVYCASPSGAPSSTDLDFVRARIELVARPDTVTVVVAAATEVPVTRTLTVWARRQDGVSAGDLADLINAALIVAIENYPIGGMAKPPATQGYLYGDFLASVVVGAHASIYDVDGADADVALAAGEVATLATTLTVRIVETGGFG